jgi:hypothetical protein
MSTKAQPPGHRCFGSVGSYSVLVACFCFEYGTLVSCGSYFRRNPSVGALADMMHKDDVSLLIRVVVVVTSSVLGLLVKTPDHFGLNNDGAWR